MEAKDPGPGRVEREPRAGDRPEVSAYETTRTRTVFTELGNGDGWIATVLTVEPTR